MGTQLPSKSDFLTTSVQPATCSLCSEPYDSEDHSGVELSLCGHQFCRLCLDKWFEKANTCPNCRTELFEKPDRAKHSDGVLIHVPPRHPDVEYLPRGRHSREQSPIRRHPFTAFEIGPYGSGYATAGQYPPRAQASASRSEIPSISLAATSSVQTGRTIPGTTMSRTSTVASNPRIATPEVTRPGAQATEQSPGWFEGVRRGARKVEEFVGWVVGLLIILIYAWLGILAIITCAALMGY
ncbi:hypothetical protein BU26DRAFT_506478 [Trematosphaeria pertusa]|uniref:RING-type domain-containing protein n=1 Tax=Trematosphaeria pertusa TaxID=390896 RepID=A0A6A6IAC3_9PLEO|nr:uncharacterized protein BU26DRAFT_506478 [Trematosphaeria pertusa]KAF2247199.1 hypothetical protein BU26DRAFT_506478 [Trematosphaeria pertusa]